MDFALRLTARQSSLDWGASLLMACWVVAFAGCGAGGDYDANVQGAVTVDGQLASGGTVVFVPVEKGPSAVGTIDQNGSYALRVGQGNVADVDRSGIPAGEYIATVSINGPSSPDEAVAEGGPPRLGPRLIADRYVNEKTSDLRFTVKKGRNVIVLKLDGPWANPPQQEEAETESERDDEDVASEQKDAPEDSVAEMEKDSAAADAASSSVGSTADDAIPSTPGEEKKQ